MKEKYICIHGHFYQPPRENAWLEEVELQDSAHPYHDWNERVTAECYEQNAASRILDSEGQIVDIVNNYSRMSFNVGPTLFSWMERHAPATYAAILEADRVSTARFSGHGSALAQVYNHMIMPLANAADKDTQVYWGIRDFEYRFRRHPEGMWLSETAVDLATLEVLARHGILFTILAPRQAHRVRPLKKGAAWEEVNDHIDPSQAYLCRLPSGKTITLFFYDGPISTGIAFQGLLNSGEAFSSALLKAFNDARTWAQLVHIATDGETYGHHHRHGDMALAFVQRLIESNDAVKLTNYGEFLEKQPPAYEVEIWENSSWSCVHGVERWRSNCGCCTGGHPGWNQQWRKPLRDAFDFLRNSLRPVYEMEAGELLKDPWGARNRYIDVILKQPEGSPEQFLAQESRKPLDRAEQSKALQLLEMQRNLMLMYTSCAWFFDEISGVETTQVLQYAAKAIQYGEVFTGHPLEEEFRKCLSAAPSNLYKNGSDVYERFVMQARLDILRVGAHYAVDSLFVDDPSRIDLFAFIAEKQKFTHLLAGRTRMTLGQVRIASRLTLEEALVTFCTLHTGDQSIFGGVRYFVNDEAYDAMQRDMAAAFERSDSSEIIRLLIQHFGNNNYSLWHLFKDEQRKVLDEIFASTHSNIDNAMRRVFEDNYAAMNFRKLVNAPLPRAFLAAAEYVVNDDLQQLFRADAVDTNKLDAVIREAQKWGTLIDWQTIGHEVAGWIDRRLGTLTSEKNIKGVLDNINRTYATLQVLSPTLPLYKPQTTFFRLWKKVSARPPVPASDGWGDAFRELGHHLRVKVA